MNAPGPPPEGDDPRPRRSPLTLPVAARDITLIGSPDERGHGNASGHVRRPAETPLLRLRPVPRAGLLTEANIKDGLREVRTALLEADVNYNVVQEFMARVNEKAVGQQLIKSVRPEQQIVKIVHDELVELMGPVDPSIRFEKAGPTIVMLCGLQGSGKTTTCGKLARLLASQGRKPLLVAADLQRPAAVEQLKVIGQQLGVPVFSEAGAEPGQGLPGRPGRGQPPGARHDHPRHRRPAPRRRRADGRAPADREEGQAAPGLLRLRRPDRPGRRRLGRRLQQGAGTRRRDHDQARRRRPRRRGAVGPQGDRRADQVRRHGREARQAPAVRPRAARRPDARHGRHRRPGRGGAVGRRRGGGAAASRRSWPRGSSTSTTSASRSSR